MKREKTSTGKQVKMNFKHFTALFKVRSIYSFLGRANRRKQHMPGRGH